MSFQGTRWLPLIAAGTLLAQSGGAPAIDTVKQTLDRRWQQLKPQDATERNVLFEDVRANRGSAGHTCFR